jgi:methyl-accepting chemotaxis protein
MRRNSRGQVAALDRSQAVIHFTPAGVITEANAGFLATMGYA